MNRDEFMELYRNDEILNSLTTDDRREIFLTVLSDKSMITEELLDELFGDYDVSDLIVCSIPLCVIPD